jgi:hypothetical protein
MNKMRYVQLPPGELDPGKLYKCILYYILYILYIIHMTDFWIILLQTSSKTRRAPKLQKSKPVNDPCRPKCGFRV